MVYEKISSFSYYTFILHVLIGTNLIVGISVELEQDAWIGAVIGTALALLMFTVYYRMNDLSGSTTFSHIHTRAFGKKIGSWVNFLYGLYFLVMATTMIGSVCFFIQMILLPYTSLCLVILPIVILFGYTLFLNFGAFARTSILTFFTITLVCIFLLLMEYFNGIVFLDRMLPVFSHSPQEIWQAVFPGVVAIPFGELIILLVFLPMVESTEYIYGKTILFIFLGGLVLAITMVVTTGILGGFLIDELNFPILKATEKISLLEFIQRLDMITLTFFVLGVFMKIGLFLFASYFMFRESIPKIKADYIIFLLMGSILLVLSLFVPHAPFEELMHFIKVPMSYFICLPFEYVLPLITVFLLFLKKNQV